MVPCSKVTSYYSRVPLHLPITSMHDCTAGLPLPAYPISILYLHDILRQAV